MKHKHGAGMLSQPPVCIKCGKMLNIKSSHTPTPWDMKSGEDGFDILGADGNIVMETLNPNSMEIANAAFIVQAVNCHEELVDELKSWHLECLVCKGDVNSGACQTAKVLAKAEGKE